MPVRNPALDDFPAKGRLLGLDIGSRRIGVAVCDPDHLFAAPLCVIARRTFGHTAAVLEDLISQNAAVGLVIGLPLNMDGSEGPRCQATRDFTHNLLTRGDRDIVFWDERLSTVSAQRAMIAADLSRRRRVRHVDQAAAALILQNFLDYLRLNPRRSPYNDVP